MLQIHAWFFLHNIKLRVLGYQQSLSRCITCQRCLSSTAACGKTPSYRNLKRTFEDSLPCCCYAIKTNSRTIRSHVSQPASAGKWVNCKLITGMTQEQSTWLLCSVNVISENKLLLLEYQLIGIKLMISDFHWIFGSWIPISRRGQILVLPPLRTPMLIIEQQFPTGGFRQALNQSGHNQAIALPRNFHKRMYLLGAATSYQRWADCEIFQSESSPDPINLNPIQSWSAKFLKIISPIQSWSANVKSCILICLMRQKNYWSYFAFSQISLVEGNILPAVLWSHEAK